MVSNFTSVLDIIAAMTAAAGWGSLRIDGGIAIDERQSLVNRFNRRSDDTFVMLLSSHAGGVRLTQTLSEPHPTPPPPPPPPPPLSQVGLNLIGANRLVLFDSDWNPAVDAQAMGRVWRQGQLLPVFIYRLLSTGTLEEKVLYKCSHYVHSQCGLIWSKDESHCLS